MVEKVAIISFPMGSRLVVNVFLYDYVEILKQIFKKIILVTSNPPENNTSEEKIQIIDLKTSLHQKGTIKPMWWSNILQFFKIFIIQLKICWVLTRIRKEVDIFIFYMGGAHLLPFIALSKIFKKKIILITAGRGSLSYEKSLDERFFSFGSILIAILKILETANFTLSDLIITESNSTVDFLKLQNYKQKIVSTGARFIDTDLFKISKALDERENLIGYIGRLEKGKGIMNFVKAIPLIYEKEKHIKFFIGGDGPLAKNIKMELNSNNLSSKVEMVGWIPHNEIPFYLNKLKLNILPSYSEGLPTGILEAMACGTPVLATSVGGIPDVIKDRETGFLMENNSPECIAENVYRSLNNKNIKIIVKNARMLIENEYTIEAAIIRYKNILEGI